MLFSHVRVGVTLVFVGAEILFSILTLCRLSLTFVSLAILFIHTRDLHAPFICHCCQNHCRRRICRDARLSILAVSPPQIRHAEFD